jgi:hypothetical protein
VRSGVVDRVVAIDARSWNVEVTDRIIGARSATLPWSVWFNALCAITGATAGEGCPIADSAVLVGRARVAESRPPSINDRTAWSPFQIGCVTDRTAAFGRLAGAAPRTSAMRSSAAE